MSMGREVVISHNISAINAQRQSGIITRKGDGITEKLSSGYRVNCAADDAAGLSICEKMRKQIRGLDRAAQNAQSDRLCRIRTTAMLQTSIHRGIFTAVDTGGISEPA